MNKHNVVALQDREVLSDRLLREGAMQLFIRQWKRNCRTCWQRCTATHRRGEDGGYAMVICQKERSLAQ